MANKTSIFFAGRVVSIPGSYTIVDPSGLEQVGLGASGIVAIIGTAEGGVPVTAITEVQDIQRASNPQRALSLFRSGPLKEAINMAFAPSTDPAILGGAQEIVFLKVNPATQGSAVLTNSEGNAIDITSADYGAFADQINVAIDDGTNQGKLVTIRFEDQLESGDDIGGDNILSLQFESAVTSYLQYTAATASVASSGAITVAGTIAGVAGEDDEVGTQLAVNGTIEVLSAAVGDTRRVEVFGLNAGGDAVREVIPLNGTTAVESITTFSVVLGARVESLLASGEITVRAAPGGATIFDTFGQTGQELWRGGRNVLAGYANGVITVVANGATTKELVVFGSSPSGSMALEKFTLNGTTPVVGAVAFSKISFVALAEVENTVALDLTFTAAQTSATTQNTVKKVVDFFAARTETEGANTAGFVATLVTTDPAFAVSRLDSTPTPATIYNVELGLKADLDAVVQWINNNSQLVEAAESAGATGGAPSNTVSPIFLAGGTEGVATFAEYQAAINLLKKLRVNTVVPLSADPAVHAALEAHCAYMGGIGRSERDAIVGALNPTLDGLATKAQLKQQIIDLNSRHVRVVGQAVERFNLAGERQEFDPPYTAVLAAGMQAGSPVGTSLTYKFVSALGFRQHSSWNPVDDAEELVQAGLWFLENVEGVGIRNVRNVTTFLQSRNIAFTEASVNEAVNFATFNFRNEMEFAVGQPGFAGTVNAIKGKGINTLGLLVAAGAITSYRSFQVDLVVDVAEVSVEIAPTIPINFVKSTLHLVTVPQSASA